MKKTKKGFKDVTMLRFLVKMKIPVGNSEKKHEMVED